VAAGLAFSSDDQATLMVASAAGTHLSTSLQDLQKLGVDSVLINGSSATVDFGALGSGVGADGVDGILSGGSLPVFGDTSGNGSLSVAEDNALAMTLNLGGSESDIAAELDQVVNLGGQLAEAGIDFIGVDGVGELIITDSQASSLVAAGLAFTGDDQVSLNVVGTHLSTSVQELNKLGIDSININIGDSDQSLTDIVLPTFSSYMDVTVDVGSSANLGALDNSIYEDFYSKGVDHLAINTSLNADGSNWLDLDLLNNINAASALDFNLQIDGSLVADTAFSLDANLAGVDLLSGSSIGNYGALVSALMESGVAEVSIEAGNVEVTDSLAKALIDAGMMQALPDANISLVYQSIDDVPADYLYTSFKDMAELGVNHVDVSTVTSDKVYIDAGFSVNEPDVLTEIKSLFNALDPQNETSFFIDGSQSTTKALVIDSSIVTSLINQSGQFDTSLMAGLEKLGITEIDVLVADADKSSLPSAEIMTNDTVAVNLIGQDDELYDFLHNKHS
jgi:hypothetical protein